MSSIEIDKVKNAIVSQDRELVIEALLNLQAEVLITTDVAVELTQPVCITELHEMLVEHLGVNQRLMRLRTRQPNLKRRAHLFAQAMINGVNYLK